MMHKIKKAVTTKSTPESAEYAEYTTKLANLSAILTSSSAELKASERTWQDAAQLQKDYAEAFSNKYPDKDVVRDYAKTSATKAQALVKEYVLKTGGTNAPHQDLDNNVKQYLEEIAAVQEEYKEINTLSTELKMYTSKVDILTKGKNADAMKTERNMEKLEEAKTAYEAKLDSVVETMKNIYVRRAIVLKSTYVAYWSSQLRACDLLNESLTETRDFVSAGVEPLRKINLASITPDEVAAFNIQGEASAEDKVQPTSPINDKLSSVVA